MEACLTYIFDGDGRPIVCIRRSFDSGPGGMQHGGDLTRLLIDIGEDLHSPEELAAMLVTEMREQLGPGGNLTLMPPTWPPPDCLQEYEFFVALSFPDGKPLVCYRESFGDGEYGDLVPLIGGQNAVTEIGAIISGADLGDVRGAAPPDPESPIALLDTLRRAIQSVIDVTRIVGRRCAEDPKGQGTSDLVYDVRAKLEELSQVAKWAEDALRLLHLVSSQRATMPSGYRDRYGA